MRSFKNDNGKTAGYTFFLMVVLKNLDILNLQFLFLYWHKSNLFILATTNPRTFLVAQRAKNLPAIQETRVWSLGQKDSLEKGMVTHFGILAWRIPWTDEPGRLQSMRSQRVGHDWATSLSLFTFMHWRRKWPPIPVFLPGESRGRGSLVGCHLWGRTESDTTEAT